MLSCHGRAQDRQARVHTAGPALTSTVVARLQPRREGSRTTPPRMLRSEPPTTEVEGLSWKDCDRRAMPLPSGCGGGPSASSTTALLKHENRLLLREATTGCRGFSGLTARLLPGIETRFGLLSTWRSRPPYL